MSISNIQRMVDALVRDEMNMVQSLGFDSMYAYIESLVIEKYENMPERHIIEEYERLA